MLQVLGLDIGGANLKAAHSNGSAISVAFPLWKQPDRLTAALRQLCAEMPAHDRLSVTMTGELCDCYPTKREGVHAIVQGVLAAAGPTPVRVWSNRARFVSCDEAMAEPYRVAAANWLAQAYLMGQRFPSERVLLIDTGSTTTDLVYLNRGTPQPIGISDPDRLSSGELVYTGVRRTPVCAVLGMEVAAEFFATMLDVYLFLKLLPEDATNRDTADGRPATRAHAHARLARMRCADVETFTPEQASDLCVRAMQTQWQALDRAIEKVVQGRPPIERIVLSGSGEVLGQSVWARSIYATLPGTLLSEVLGASLSTAACAYAVAVLAAQE